MSITLVFPGVRIVSRSWLWRSLPRPNCRGSQRKFRRVSPRTAGAAQGFQGDFGWGTGFLQRMGTVSEHGEKMRENMFFCGIFVYWNPGKMEEIHGNDHLGGWKILKDDSGGPPVASTPRLSGAKTPRFSLETQSHSPKQRWQAGKSH